MTNNYWNDCYINESVENELPTPDTEAIKICPFIQKRCIKESCNLFSTKQNICSLNATAKGVYILIKKLRTLESSVNKELTN